MKHIIGKITRRVSDFIRGGVLAGRGDRYVPPSVPPDVAEFHEIPKVFYAIATALEIPALCRADATVNQIPRGCYATGDKIEIPRVFGATHT